MNDIRWKQRLQNLSNAFTFLESVVSKPSFTPLEAAGLVQSFEFTFELSWKTLKDYLESEGFTPRSPRETIKQAFQSGYIEDGHLWIEMLDKLNELSHTYNRAQADAATEKICKRYFLALQQVVKALEARV